jgi:hypothetical protein
MRSHYSEKIIRQLKCVKHVYINTCINIFLYTKTGLIFPELNECCNKIQRRHPLKCAGIS